MQQIKFIILIGLVTLVSCKKSKNLSQRTVVSTEERIKVTPMLESATKQLMGQLDKAIRAEKIPRTVNENDSIRWVNPKFDWTEGFFPGSCWYLYESTGDPLWKDGAVLLQKQIESHKFRTDNHDLGFVFNCSFGNGLKITKDEVYKDVLVTAANSLITRFNEKVGCIKSWDVDKGWQSEKGWEYPVIIDNMMNLELLFEVSKLTGDSKYRDIAITHANTTMKNHFRANHSSCHVVDYNPDTGKVRGKYTAQGYSDDSSWARGQAWGLYGYVVCYRYTNDKRYLDQANKIAKYILGRLPEDFVPYWDYDTPDIPNAPRDVSAAAITISALIELDGFTEVSYLKEIDKILKSLSSDVYTAKLGENHNFILKHSVGSIPHGAEIDVPLSYADYYYIEALIRYQRKYMEG